MKMDRNLLILLAIMVAAIIVIAAVAYSVVSKDNAAPTAVIDLPVTGKIYSEDDNVELFSRSSSDPEGGDLKYSWSSNISGDLGSGAYTSLKFKAGTHKVTLVVTDDGGQRSTAEIVIYVYPLPGVVIDSPEKSLDYYSTELIFFDGSNSSSRYSSELEFSWSSDLDGSLGRSERIYSKLTSGIHVITLEVDDGLSKATEEITIDVEENELPEIVITSPKYNDIFTADSEILFDCSDSSDPDGHDLFYNWSSNIDGLIGTKATFSARLSANSHIITLNVSDEYGGEAESSIIISVNSQPVAIAKSVSNAEVGEKITFDASDSFDLDGDDITCKWDFGDGSKDIGMKVDHTYGMEGIYEVNLTVSDPKGGVGYDALYIEIIYIFSGPGIHGYVYDDETKKPLVNVELMIFGWEDFFFDDTNTNENGYYEIETADGDFDLSCDEDGYLYYDEEITVENNEVVKHDIYLVRPPPETARLYGYVYDKETNEPIFDADVDLDSDEGYYNYTWTEVNGYYEMNTPAGEFSLYCYAYDWEDDIEYDAYFTEIVLFDYQSVQHDIYLKRRVPSESNITIEFTSWDFFTVTDKTVEYSNTDLIRSSMDMNEDGQVSELEVTEYETMMEIILDEEMAGGLTTEDYIYVDNIYFNYVQGSINIEIEGATGSVNSGDPITLINEGNFESDQTITISNSHDVWIDIEYDDAYSTYELYVSFPTLFRMTNYTAEENINVSGTNPVSIDPLQEPASGGGETGDWVKMEVTRVVR